jgi:signal transduction histidine kinase
MIKNLSIRTKLLVVVAAGLLLVTAGVSWLADAQLHRAIDQKQDELFAERIASITSVLQSRHDLLVRTGMVEAYRHDIQDQALRDLVEKYYAEPSAGYPFIVDDRGHVIMHPVLPRGDTSVVSHPLMVYALARDVGEKEYSYKGQDKWCMFQRFEPWGWTVFQTIPLDAKYADARQFRWTFLSGMAVMGLVLIGAVLTLVSLATQPIRELTRAAGRMADGELDVRINVAGTDEIGDLARSFSKMSGAIRDKISSLDTEVSQRRSAQKELAALNSELEDRIAARTAALEQANRAKNQFLANMSHEIRTPMTAVLGFADLLAESLECCGICPEHHECTVRQENREHIGAICSSGRHLLGIINDILDLSKVEAGKMPMDIQPCNVAAVVSDVAAMMRMRADASGLQLVTEYPTALPETILTDEARVKQALVNLAGNAVKFTHDGSVTIRPRFVPHGRNGEPALTFEVVDTGIGIPAEAMERLFAPFEQADASTSRKFGGTGLGLAISRRIADLLGGRLSAESEPGSGSTFRLTVPCGNLDGVRMVSDPVEMLAEMAEPETPQAHTSLAGLRILLAEDAEANRKLICAVLRKAGAEVGHPGTPACRLRCRAHGHADARDGRVPGHRGAAPGELRRPDPGPDGQRHGRRSRQVPRRRVRRPPGQTHRP